MLLRFSPRSIFASLVVCGLVFFAACTVHIPITPNGTGEETAAESLAMFISNAADSTDGSLVAEMRKHQSPPPNLYRWLQELMIPSEQEAIAANVCPTLSTSVCSGGASLLTYNNCTRTATSTPIWSGTGGQAATELFTFNSQSVCQAVTSGNVDQTGGTATRVYGGSVGADDSVSVIYTNSNSTQLAVLLDSTTTSGYNSSVYQPVKGAASGAAVDASKAKPSGGFYHTYNCNAVANQTCVDVSGVEEVAFSTTDGSKVFDHTFSTLNGAPITVQGSSTNRSVTGGTVFMQHNTYSYTAEATISKTLSHFTSSCCFPGTGQISLTYTNGQSNSTAIDFGDCNQSGTTATGCGAATVTKSDGTKMCVTLTSCH